MVSYAKLVLEKQTGATAPDAALRNDGLPVRQDVRLIHEVSGQEDDAI